MLTQNMSVRTKHIFTSIGCVLLKDGNFQQEFCCSDLKITTFFFLKLVYTVGFFFILFHHHSDCSLSFWYVRHWTQGFIYIHISFNPYIHMQGEYCYFYLPDETEAQINYAITCPTAVSTLVGDKPRIKILASLNPKFFFLHSTGYQGSLTQLFLHQKD